MSYQQQRQQQQQPPYDAHVSPRSMRAARDRNQGSPVSEQQMQRLPSPSAVGTPSMPAAHPVAPPVAAAPGPVAAAAPAPVPAPLLLTPVLPFGAVPYNGGVLYDPNVFSGAYRVPGPEGRDYVYYDHTVPMPPAQPGGPPSLKAQWHSLTKTLKAFVVCLLLYWLLQWLVHPVVALFMPLLFLPSWLLYRQWRKHYESVELYLLVKLYATAFVPGAIVVMIVESVITIFFVLLCFQSYISTLLTPPGSTPAPGDAGSTKPGEHEAPPGMEFLNEPESPALFVFLFLLSFVSAGLVEESLKYYCASRVRKLRPSYRVLRGYGMYAIAGALGFSTMENIGYVLAGAFSKGGDNSLLGVFLNVCGRVLVSTPLHVGCGYLLGLQVARRDVLGEPLPLWRVMGLSVFFHGLFDFGLFTIMVLQRHWSSGPDDNAVSYVLMAAVVINCGAGLAYCIYRTHQKVFNRVVVAAEEEQVHAGHEQAAPDAVDRIRAGLARASPSVGNNHGFARLHNEEEGPQPVGDAAV